MFAPHQRTRTRAFSLIELLTVMGIVVLLSTLAVSTFRNTNSTQLSAGVQRTISMFTMARTEAAVHRLPTRVAIAVKWNGNEKAEYRALSIWRTKENAPTEWQQVTAWEYLPEGVVFAPDKPGNELNYGTNSVAYFFDGALNNADAPAGSDVPGEMKFVEFLPNGTVRTPDSEVGDDFLVRLAEGYRKTDGTISLRQGESQDNFADVVTYSLVGRIKAFRP